MREITDHIISGADAKLRIYAMDEPGAGGAHHVYEVHGFPGDPLRIEFQNGPIVEKGINGVTNEVLLAVAIDRLRSFQAGPFKCAENGTALVHAHSALRLLQLRTRVRQKQGVEGRNLKHRPAKSRAKVAKPAKKSRVAKKKKGARK